MQCEPTVWKKKKKWRKARIARDNTTHNPPCWLRGKRRLVVLCYVSGSVRGRGGLEKGAGEGAGDSKWSWQSEDLGKGGLTV